MLVLTRNWWALALRGLAAIIFGILALVVPHITLVVLIAFFGAYVLVDGFFTLVAAVRAAEQHTRWWPLLVEGVAGIIAGVLTFIWPGLTALVLLYFIAAWAIVTGVFEVLAAIRLRREIRGEWLLGLSGVLSVLFGLLLIAFPGAGALTVVWLIGAYALVFGVVLVGLALRLRNWGHERIRPRAFQQSLMHR
ncbi:MAG TPA: HdeD family acid-resistance protein [Chloroflexota bacterium]|nr:HdeD family acid-resistance protein [Chloroflexota bacterium]